MVKGLFLGVFCFLLFLLHTSIFHRFNIRRKFFAVALSFFGGLFIYTLLFLAVPREYFQNIAPALALAFLNGAFLHFFFYYFYIHFIQIMDRSVSTRMMTEIEKSPACRLKAEELEMAYSMDEKISTEMEDMVILGRLIKDGDEYRLAPKGRLHSAVFKNVRDYLRLRRS
ncbi:MAG: hypothetical protein WC532_08580 [Candidatus Omnitrophota bacterium]